ncbi:MAG: hypothetical protein U0798_10300 [Gemmataceae bacterium]
MISIRKAFIAAIALIGSVSVASAQPVVPGGAGTPQLSPYLNLLRNSSNNSNPAFNYLTITRPQQQFAMQANQLNQQIQSNTFQLQQQQAAMNGAFALGYGDANMPLTGHKTTFNSLGSHFNNLGGAFSVNRMGGSQIGQGMMFRPQAGMGTGSSMTGAAGGAMGGAAGIRR